MERQGWTRTRVGYRHESGWEVQQAGRFGRWGIVQPNGRTYGSGRYSTPQRAAQKAEQVVERFGEGGAG